MVGIVLDYLDDRNFMLFAIDDKQAYFLLYRDGDLVGAVLDRNGLRPSRYMITDDDTLILSSEVGVLPIDPTKITNALGWYPETKFEDGIVKTIVWYLENQDWVEEVTSGDYQGYYEKMYGK